MIWQVILSRIRTPCDGFDGSSELGKPVARVFAPNQGRRSTCEFLEDLLRPALFKRHEESPAPRISHCPPRHSMAYEAGDFVGDGADFEGDAFDGMGGGRVVVDDG